jgi:hypothetical protein
MQSWISGSEIHMTGFLRDIVKDDLLATCSDALVVSQRWNSYWCEDEQKQYACHKG